MAVEQNLWTLFSAVAAAVPNREAVVFRARRLTFAALADRAARFASVLRAHGLGHHRPRAGLAGWEAGQDLVALYLLNGPEYLEAQLGGLAARTAPFNVNYRYVAHEVADLLADADAAAVVYHARFAPVLAEALPRLGRAPLLLQVADGSPHPRLPGAVDYEAALAAAAPEVPEDQSADDLFVLYTGGTTGMPKGVLWRQHDLWTAVLGGHLHPDGATTDEIVERVVARRPGRVLPNAPLMHGAALWTAVGALLSGDTVVINGVVDRLDPVDVWTTVERERVQHTVFVGEAFARPLLDELEAGTYDMGSLRSIVVGGAFTSPEAKQRILAQLPDVRVVDLAASSETGRMLHTVAVAGTKPEHGVFTLSPGAAVLDEHRQRRLGPDERAVGWLAKSGPIPLGYLGDREKTASTFPVVDGERWVVPGDRARLRSDGSVELLGRDSVTINSAGEKIFAEEVEAAVLAHPGVRDAVVVGRPNDRWGQEVVAVVEVEPGAAPSDDDVLAVASTRIARYKLPKAIVRVGQVRRGPAGKADYAWAHQVATGGPGHVDG